MKDEESEKGILGQSSVFAAKEIESTQWAKYKGEKGGHGFAAEDANALNDKLKGKKVDKVGTSNKFNGPDRVANGIEIQTKYYNSAKRSIEAGFDNTTGQYRYEGQVLEVPSDQYDEAVSLMKNKIREGKVPGVTDPDKAVEIVKKGDVTYTQARNIAKAGNIDSLWFDIKNQSVVSSYALGISFVITYANGVWHGLSKKQAFKLAFCNALRTGAVVLVVGVSTSQLLRTSLGRSFAAFTTKMSRQIVTRIYGTKIGKDLIEKMASAILKKTLYGAAAKNAISKLLRSNIVTGTVTAVVFTIPDVYKTIISKRISWAQFSKNFATTVTGIAGGFGGAVGGATIGTLVFPGIGTTIGGIVGGVVGGISSAIAAKKIADHITPDDAEIMVKAINRRITELAYDYMLTDDELSEYIIPIIEKTVNNKWIQEMYGYCGSRSNITKQNEFVDSNFESEFEFVLQRRSQIILPKKLYRKWFSFKTKISLFITYLKISIISIFKKTAIA
ncbi:hypothetical protein [uncultured Treponema sp.]|uniref:hypothetical protein n=1 Tax=uncultured Treponema sp. TaxID=162155 RepID=UPI0028E7877C|nr:hypothetical protein [uncultured Treponema sp.]